MTDYVARVNAGLDRDEAIARAASKRAEEWRADGGGVAGGPFEPRPDWLDADEEWTTAESGTHTIVYNEGYPLDPEARHIAEFDPARILRVVEALRDVANVAQVLLEDGDDAWVCTRAAHILDALADIYPEEQQ